MAKEEFEFFWNGPFSQWYPARFKAANGLIYNCAEQYMMHQKALLFKDKDTAKKIMNTNSPREQKALGRKVKGFNKGTWEAIARTVVSGGNFYKFTQHKDLKAILLATAPKTLVEASPYDEVWGIGLAEDDKRALDRSTWRGKNWLGEVLTELRERLNHD